MATRLQRTSHIGLTPKLVLVLIMFSIIPMSIVAYMGFDASHEIEETAGKRFQVTAENIGDKIDRNLFERYGDVQAFGKNRILSERYNWYTPGEHDNEIAKVMNEYVATYGIYSLTIFVDPQGDVIAVNDKDSLGNQIDTRHLYKKNYKSAPWFQAVASGTYTTAMPFTAKGNDISTGTFIEDVHVDEDVKAVYADHEGLTLGFTSPVYTDSGELLGYWSNRAKFSLVEEIIQQAYGEIKYSGYPGAEITLLDGTGNIIVDYDPRRYETENVVHDMDNVILKFNLAQKGVAVAQAAVAGETGHQNSSHARKQIMQASGYSHLKGALGYPGMNWSVLVRVPLDEAAIEATAIQRNIILSALIGLALVLPMGIVMGRTLVGRLKPVMEVAEKASQGDLTCRVPVATKDELGQMGQAFNGFLDQLSRMLNQITEVTHNVAASSEQLSVNGGQVAQSSREQSNQATQVASAVEEMSATANEMAKNTQALASSAQEVNQAALRGGDVVANSIQGMESVTSTMHASADRINALGQRSQEIGEIIRVIEDIADQTNLLALNAAIEAARAGEQGRGFAVVADEVRKLAERTGKATKEIAGVIETVQVGTHEAVNSMEAGTAEAQKGMALAQEAGQRLSEIVDGVQGVADMVHQIAGSTEEQSQVSDQIAQSIQTVAGLSQQNEGNVGQVASASSDLASMASQLQTAVSQFKLKS